MEGMELMSSRGAEGVIAARGGGWGRRPAPHDIQVEDQLASSAALRPVRPTGRAKRAKEGSQG